MKKRRLIAMLLCLCMTASSITPVLANEDVLLSEDAIEELEIIEESIDDEIGSYSIEGISLFAESATDEISGEFGEGLTWDFDADAGLLTISGTGAMPRDWESSYDAPWYSYTSQIVNVVVEEGVSSVAPYAFAELIAAETIELPSTITSVHYTSFMDCTSLEAINIEGGENFYSIDGVLFFEKGEDITLLCYPIKKDGSTYTVPDGVTHINSYAFKQVVLEEITFPDSLKVIYDFAFERCKIPVIEIPSNIESIDMPCFRGNIVQSFYVDEENEYYTSVDGVLYTKDMTLLIAYPHDNSRETFTVPEGVVSIPNDIYTTAYRLKTLYIPSSLEEIVNLSIYLHYYYGSHNNMEYIFVDSENEYYSDIDGVLFNKDTTELICYPTAKGGTEYIIPDSTTTILTFAFYDVQNLETIVFHENISAIEGRTFYYCPNMTGAYFYGDVPETFGWGTSSPPFASVPSSFVIYYIDGVGEWTSPTYRGYNTATFIPDTSAISTTFDTTEITLEEGAIFNFEGLVSTTAESGLDDIQINIYNADTGIGIKYDRRDDIGTQEFDLSAFPSFTTGTTLTGYNELGEEQQLELIAGTSWNIQIFATDNAGSYLAETIKKITIIAPEVVPVNVTVECLDTEDYAGNYRDFTVTFDSLPTNAYLQFDNQYAPNEWLSNEYCSTNPAFIIDNSNLTETENGYVYKTTFIIHSEGLASNSYMRKVRVAYPTADGITYSEPFEFNVYPIPDVPQNKIGYAYTQTLDISDNTELPAITAVVAADKNSYYRLTIATYTCDDDADVFFYWEADSGEFQRVSDDFSVVDFIPDGNSTVTAYMGDGLGYVASYTLNINQ